MTTICLEYMFIDVAYYYYKICKLKIRGQILRVAYYIVEFEHLHIQLKVTLIKTKPVEVTSETLVENLS